MVKIAVIGYRYVGVEKREDDELVPCTTYREMGVTPTVFRRGPRCNSCCTVRRAGDATDVFLHLLLAVVLQHPVRGIRSSVPRTGCWRTTCSTRLHLLHVVCPHSLHYPTLPCTTLHCHALSCTTLQYPALPCTTLPCTTLIHYPALPSTLHSPLPCTPLYPAIPCTILCTILCSWCTTLHDDPALPYTDIPV